MGRVEAFSTAVFNFVFTPSVFSSFYLSVERFFYNAAKDETRSICGDSIDSDTYRQ